MLPGGEEWLPAAEWPGMKVFRIEAALKPPPRGTRAAIHFDAYLLQFSRRGQRHRHRHHHQGRRPQLPPRGRAGAQDLPAAVGGVRLAGFLPARPIVTAPGIGPAPEENSPNNDICH